MIRDKLIPSIDALRLAVLHRLLERYLAIEEIDLADLTP